MNIALGWPRHGGVLCIWMLSARYGERLGWEWGQAGLCMGFCWTWHAAGMDKVLG
jgi:hypothetical protein